MVTCGLANGRRYSHCRLVKHLPPRDFPPRRALGGRGRAQVCCECEQFSLLQQQTDTAFGKIVFCQECQISDFVSAQLLKLRRQMCEIARSAQKLGSTEFRQCGYPARARNTAGADW